MRLNIIMCILTASLLLTGCSDAECPATGTMEADAVRLLLGAMPSDGRGSSARSTESSVNQISLYMSGGVTCDGAVFTLENGEWVNDSVTLKWVSDAPAQIMAYCPPLTDGVSLYDDDGSLCDWLVCSDTVAFCNDIILDFEHLTAQICFNVSSSLNDDVEEISFTPSLRLTAIDAWSGTVSCDSENLMAASFVKSDDASYTVNVPAGEALTVDIRLDTTDGRTYTASTSMKTLGRGVSYGCEITVEEESEPGVSTASDFIDLMTLLGEGSVEGKSLEDFGETGADGVTTYCLLCDIDLSEYDSTDIQTIGTSSNPFNDCFDGQGFTISGLVLPEEPEESNYGLFCYIGTGGVVKNLTLSGAQMACSGSDAINNTGLLCGFNNGTIDNCHLESCTISSVQSKIAGCMVGMNQGTLVNCSVTGTTMYNSFSSSSIAAGLVGQNEGDAVNCYVAQSKLYCDQTAGICGKSASSCTLTNVYAYKITKTSGNDHGGVVFNHASGTYTNCFSSVSYGVYSLSTQPDGILQFTQESGELPKYGDDTLDTLFNEWIEASAASVYPDLNLLNWEQGDTTIPYVLVNEE